MVQQAIRDSPLMVVGNELTGQARTCPNCQTVLVEGNVYCPGCAQKVEGHTLNLREFLWDVWEEFFRLDNKILQTLKLLLLQPGALTVEYMAGRRMRYLSPLKLLFWTGFIEVATLGLLNAIRPEKPSLASGVIRDQASQIFMGWLAAQPYLLFVLMLPMTALLLVLLFRRHKRPYIEHFVLATHLTAFYMVADTVSFVVMRFWPENIAILLIISYAKVYVLFNIYNTLAMRRLYQQRWGLILAKSIVFMVGFALVQIATMILGARLVSLWLMLTHR